MNLTCIHEDSGLMPGQLSGLRIRHCHELWCRSQKWLRSGVAVAVTVACSCRSNWTLSLGTSVCHRCSPKKQKKKKKKKKKKNPNHFIWENNLKKNGDYIYIYIYTYIYIHTHFYLYLKRNIRHIM